MKRFAAVVGVLFFASTAVADDSCYEQLHSLVKTLMNDTEEVSTVDEGTRASFLLSREAQHAVFLVDNAADLFYLMPLVAPSNSREGRRFIRGKLSLLSSALESNIKMTASVTRGNKDTNVAVAANVLRSHERDARAVLDRCTVAVIP